MAPYVKWVESNGKGGVRATLSPKTIIFGNNGTGKGALSNAVELALTGRVSDIQGRREVAREADLIAHLAPDRKSELFARAVLSDDGECMWRAGGKSKKSTHAYPTSVDPASALPLRPVYDAITGNPDTARKFFLEYAVGTVTDRDVLDRLPASLRPFYNKATLASTLSTNSAVDRLLAAMERAKKLAKDAHGRAKASRALADENAQGLAPLPTDEEEKQLKAAVKEAENRVQAVRASIVQAETLAGIGERLAAVRAVQREAQESYDAAVAREKETQTTLATVPVPPALDRVVVSVIEAMEEHRKAGLTSCLVCSSPGTVDFERRIEAARAWRDSMVVKEQAYSLASNQAATATVRRVSEQSRLQDANSALAALEQTSPLMEAPPTPDYLAACEQQVRVHSERLRAVDVLRASWSSASKARDGAQEAENEGDSWDKLVDACTDVISKLIDHGISGFQARVQALLPPQDDFRITLRDGERTVFRFGLLRSGHVDTALSGAEWARVTAALAGVCSVPNKVAVVIPEDRGHDAATLRRVLDAFSHVEAQVLFSTPIMPEGGVPPGWTLINTGENEHRAGIVDEKREPEPARPLPLFG